MRRANWSPMLVVPWPYEQRDASGLLEPIVASDHLGILQRVSRERLKGSLAPKHSPPNLKLPKKIRAEGNH
jgi:hypothetical protein